MDEDALNVMLAEGIDPATALAGAARDRKPEKSNLPHTLGLIAAILAAGLVFWLLAR